MFAIALPRRSHRRGVGACVILLLCAGAVIGCATTAADVDGTPLTADSDRSSPADPDLPGPTDPDAIGEDPPALAWLPPGPSDPADPSPESFYGKLRDRQCADLIEVGEPFPPWRAAGLVCRALETGDPTTWEDAALARAAVDPSALSCLDTAALALIDRALAHYAAHGQPEAVSVPSGGGAGCPLALTGLATTEGLRFADTQPQVSACGGDTVRLMGLLMGVTSADVGGVSVPVRNDGVHWYVFSAPALADTGANPVTVVAHGPGGALPGGAELFYVEDVDCAAGTE